MDGIRGRQNDLQVVVARPDGPFEDLATDEFSEPNEPKAAEEAWAHYHRPGSIEKLKEPEDLF